MIISGKPGEVWFSEADTPAGPWAYARRVAEHGTYNFYNPTQHPFFDQEGGRLIYFEGTYTASFSGAKVHTPRYDYNQIMYRLALDDPRLLLPVAVYLLKDGEGKTRHRTRDGVEAENAWNQISGIAFFALPRKPPNREMIPLYPGSEGASWRTNAPSSGEAPLCFALPLSAAGGDADASGQSQSLMEIESLGRVWKSPGQCPILDPDVHPVHSPATKD
jgi:hypothetical protein